jgi:hypothetical protein
MSDRSFCELGEKDMGAPNNLPPESMMPVFHVQPLPRPIEQPQQEGGVGHGRFYTKGDLVDKSADLADLEKKSSRKNKLKEVFSDLAKASTNPESFAAKKTQITAILNKDLKTLNETERKYFPWTKKVILVALSILTLGAITPFAYILYSRATKQFSLDRDFHTELLKALDSTTQESAKGIPQVKTKSLGLQSLGSSPVTKILLDQQRGTDPTTEISSLQIPNFLLDDMRREYNLQISIADNPRMACAPGRLPAKERDPVLATFTKQVFSQLDDDAYGTEKEKQNIIQNTFSFFSQNVLLSQIATISENCKKAGSKVGPWMPSGRKLSERTKGEIPDSTETRILNSKIDSKNCTQTAMGIYDLTSFDNPFLAQKYQVVIIQNRIPLDAMKKSYAELDENPGLLKKSESTTLFSKVFDTPQEALAYFNTMQPLVEAGTPLEFLEQSSEEWAHPLEKLVFSEETIEEPEIMRLDPDEEGIQENLPPPPALPSS